MHKLNKLESEELRLLVKVIDDGLKEEPNDDYLIELKEVQIGLKIERGEI